MRRVPSGMKRSYCRPHGGPELRAREAALSGGRPERSARAEPARVPREAQYLELSESEAFAQAEQPEPQPPTDASASPSSTWKLWPQPQDEPAFGLLMAKPAAW